jgi:hypothetical protein
MRPVPILVYEHVATIEEACMLMLYRIIEEFSETSSLLCPEHLGFKGSYATEERLMSLFPQYVCSNFNTIVI